MTSSGHYTWMCIAKSKSFRKHFGHYKYECCCFWTGSRIWCLVLCLFLTISWTTLDTKTMRWEPFTNSSRTAEWSCSHAVCKYHPILLDISIDVVSRLAACTLCGWIVRFQKSYVLKQTTAYKCTCAHTLLPCLTQTWPSAEWTPFTWTLMPTENLITQWRVGFLCEDRIYLFVSESRKLSRLLIPKDAGWSFEVLSSPWRIDWKISRSDRSPAVWEDLKGIIRLFYFCFDYCVFSLCDKFWVFLPEAPSK